MRASSSRFLLLLAATAAASAMLLLAGTEAGNIRAQEQRLIRVALARSLSAPALWGIGPFAAKYGLRTENVQAVTNADDMYAKHKALVPERYGNPEKSDLTAEIKPGKNELKFQLK